ncbi:MAG: TrpB-like pyridoxal phosphate-dependent enzyme [Candidatus Heimdallarchaeota archaeon]
MPSSPQIILAPEDIPRKWYNPLAHDIKLPPPREPETNELPSPDPLDGMKRFDFLGQTMIPACLEMESSTQATIDIPEGIIELFLRVCRPRPLMRALGLERALKLPDDIKIYYKTEFFSPPGSHKLNTALAQVWYAREHGIEGVSTETGAGQWGSALSFACSLLDMKCIVFWVRSAFNRFPERKRMIELYGAEVHPSPTNLTTSGKKLFGKDPNHPGSLGIAISEGLETALESNGKLKYSLGSVLNHVLIQQSIIGLETKKQFESIDEQPTQLIACLGGGSNFGGFALPFLPDIRNGKLNTELIAVNTKEIPNLRGEYKYDYGDHAGMTPMLKMLSLGHEADMPTNVPAEGLLYHAAAPIISALTVEGMVKPAALDWLTVKESGRLFMRKEGFIPAPESSYGIAQAIIEAKKKKEKGEPAVIGINISGHGLLGMDSI